MLLKKLWWINKYTYLYMQIRIPYSQQICVLNSGLTDLENIDLHTKQSSKMCCLLLWLVVIIG